MDLPVSDNLVKKVKTLCLLPFAMDQDKPRYIPVSVFPSSYWRHVHGWPEDKPLTDNPSYTPDRWHPPTEVQLLTKQPGVRQLRVKENQLLIVELSQPQQETGPEPGPHDRVVYMQCRNTRHNYALMRRSIR